MACGQVGTPPRFSFRDLRVLRIVRDLEARGVSQRRVRRELTALHERLPDASSIAELTLDTHNGHVVVSHVEGEERRSWRADTGQLIFDFLGQSQQADITPLPVRREVAAPEPVFGLTADEWIDRAQQVEEDDPATAITAYRRALRLRPDCSETLVNLGRLYAETGESSEAAECFREALELDPSDATAVYNLGVVAQDEGHDDEAIDLYLQALVLNPELSEAHYNLATIYDRTGDARSAIRHINEYRKLTRDTSPR